MDQNKNVLVSRVVPYPGVPNIRGAIRDTTGLQHSIERHGLHRPLWVATLEGFGEEYEDKYGLIGGARRLTATRALGWSEVPVIVKDVSSLADVRALMIIDNQNEEIPEIVLDKEANVVGGMCEAVYRLVTEDKLNNQQAADVLGDVTADTVGAYVRLWNEFPEMKRRVEKGDLAITAYSKMKSKSEEIKRFVLDNNRGHISARTVTGIVRNWAEVKAKHEMKQARKKARQAQKEAEAAGEDPEAIEVPEIVEYEAPKTPVQHLRDALGSLKQVEAGKLTPAEIMLLRQIKQAYEALEGDLVWKEK